VLSELTSVELLWTRRASASIVFESLSRPRKLHQLLTRDEGVQDSRLVETIDDDF